MFELRTEMVGTISRAVGYITREHWLDAAKDPGQRNQGEWLN
jgi:hypothetical protein